MSAAFPPETRGKALGLFSGITGLAILGGPVIGGAVVQGLAWQWIFWLNVPIGIVLVPLVLRQVAERLRPARPVRRGGLTWSGARRARPGLGPDPRQRRRLGIAAVYLPLAAGGCADRRVRRPGNGARGPRCCR